MIRPMTPADRQPVLDLVRETDFFRLDEIEVAAELIDIYLGRPGQKDYRVVVIEDDAGGVAGYLTYGPTPLTSGTFDFYWMAVAPSEQGRGFGKALVRWAEDRIRADKGRLILIETSSQPKYGPTREFYVRLGYRETARIPDFYGPGDARVIFMKRLEQE